MLNHLYSPYKIKGKTLKNRCVVPPMVMNYCNNDGTVTERFMAYHEARAKGGFGMIITEDFAVDPYGRGFKYLPGLWEDGQIEGYAEFTKRIHRHGSLIIAQIYHCGRQTNKDVIGKEPLAPSAIPCPFSPDMPREMSIDEIKRTVSQFGDTARRAEEAGFDGIEIHGAHGYLISQFMSSYSNKRTDEYGGSLENRMRFALEIIEDIRSKVSDDFIVGYRISADEYVTGGRSIEDTKAIVPCLEKSGIDYVHVSAGVYRSFDAIIPSMYCKHGWIADLAKEVKEITDLPIITVGRINDPRVANAIVAAGKSDLVSFGRQSLCDPETPIKGEEGRFEDIRNCIACHHGCVGNLMANRPVRCILNPYLGEEFDLEDVSTEKSKNVMVIGAGPGGLSAAIEAAKAGHKVKVFEKNRWAGGQFRLGAVPTGKGEIINFINWQLNELNKLNVQVNMNTEVTLDLVKEENPDLIIAAPGAEPVIPRIPGIDKAHVVTAHDVLAGNCNTGGSVVVIGGGCAGAEVANHLASNLKAVSLVEIQNDIALDEMIVPRWGILDELALNKVRILTGTTVEEITDTGVRTSGALTGEITADTVVLAVGVRPVTGLVDQIKEAGLKVQLIGDAKEVGLAGEAVMEGFLTGRSL